MPGIAIVLAAGPVLVSVALLLLHAGLRAGDRPGDVVVTAALGTVSQPDGSAAVAVATVRNPAPGPVLVGLSVRPCHLPRWLGTGLTVSVPRRTTRAALRPGRQAVVGVAAAMSVASWQVPVPATGRRWRLVAVAGQEHGRLRVIRTPVRAGQTPAPAPGPRPGIPQPGA